ARRHGMADIINVAELPESLQSHEMIDLMVAGLNANATRIAQSLASDEPAPTTETLAEATLVLIGIIKRWVEAGSGAVVQQSAGPFQQTIDNKQRLGWNLWPSDIEQLQDLCKESDGSGGKAFSIDMSPTLTANHLPWCSLM